MNTEDHLCTHPIGQCEIVDTVDVVPNSFNIVLDKQNVLFSHVLQCSESNTIKNKIQELINNVENEYIKNSTRTPDYYDGLDFCLDLLDDLKALIKDE